MGGLDYITILIYLVGLFAIGVISARRNTNQKEMFSAGGKSPWWASGLSGFMTVFSAATFVVWGGIAYELGMVAVVINLTYGIASLLVGFFVAAKWNRMGVDTPAEFVHLRFGKTGLHFFTWTMMFKRIMGVSASLYALGVLLTAQTADGAAIVPLSMETAIIVFGAIVILYTMQGGLWAVLMTDVLQFIVLTLVVFVVAALLMADLGSYAVFRDNVPDSFMRPVSGKYTWYFLCGWTAINFFSIGAEWAFAQRFIAVRSPADARKSAILFGVMYLVTPLFWMMPPLLYRAQAGYDETLKEQAYILASQSVLPTGLLGLMVAAMFSATASMVSSQLNVFAGVLTNDFYKPLLNPKASEKTLVFVGRLFTAFLGILLVVTAITIPKMGGAEKLIVTINSMLVVPLLAPALWGMFSRKIGLRHLLIVALTCFSIGVGLRFGLPAITDEGDALWSLTQYILEHKKVVEMLLGVLLPVFMLVCFELTLKRTDKGNDRVRTRAEKRPQAVGDTTGGFSFDAFPARMVVISLLCLGAWVVFIATRDASARSVLFPVGVILFVLAAAIEWWVRTKTRSLHDAG